MFCGHFFVPMTSSSNIVQLRLRDSNSQQTFFKITRINAQTQCHFPTTCHANHYRAKFHVRHRIKYLFLRHENTLFKSDMLVQLYVDCMLCHGGHWWWYFNKRISLSFIDVATNRQHGSRFIVPTCIVYMNQILQLLVKKNFFVHTVHAIHVTMVCICTVTKYRHCIDRPDLINFRMYYCTIIYCFSRIQ